MAAAAARRYRTRLTVRLDPPFGENEYETRPGHRAGAGVSTQSVPISSADHPVPSTYCPPYRRYGPLGAGSYATPLDARCLGRATDPNDRADGHRLPSRSDVVEATCAPRRARSLGLGGAPWQHRARTLVSCAFRRGCGSETEPVRPGHTALRVLAGNLVCRRVLIDSDNRNAMAVDCPSGLCGRGLL